MTTQLKVGDKVIFVKCHGARPVTTNVDRVTKTGQVYIGPSLSKDRFKVDWRGVLCSVKGGAEVHPHSDEKLAELNAKADESEAVYREREEEAKTRKTAREQEKANQLAAVKEAVGGKLDIHPITVWPNRAKVVHFTLPVHPTYGQRKGASELVVVRLAKVEDYDWPTGEKATKIEGHCTNSNEGSSSFSSWSGIKGQTEEEVLWEIARDVYHSW